MGTLPQAAGHWKAHISEPEVVDQTSLQKIPLGKHWAHCEEPETPLAQGIQETGIDPELSDEEMPLVLLR